MRAMQLIAVTVTTVFLIPSLWILKTGVDQERIKTNIALFQLQNKTHRCYRRENDVIKTSPLADIINRQQYMLASIRNYCSKQIHKNIAIVKPAFATSDTFYNDKMKIVYCSVANTENLHWDNIMMHLEGKIQHPFNKENKSYKVAKELNKLEGLNDNQCLVRLNSYYNFLFVRNPFERLLLIYLSLINNDPKNSELNSMLRREMTYMASNNKMQPSHKNKIITFNEFIAYVTRHMSASEEINKYWLPITTLCQPCLVKYNFIGSFETLVDDSNFVLDHVGMKKSIRFSDFHKNQIDIYEEGTKYYKSVSKPNLKKLKLLYKADMEAFGFHLPNYIMRHSEF